MTTLPVYAMLEEIGKHAVDNESQVSHCQKKMKSKERREAK